MFICKNRYSILFNAIATALACLFCVNTLSFAGPDTLAPFVGNPKVYQEMRQMMEKKLGAHQDPIDEFIKQRAHRAKNLSSIPYLEEEFIDLIKACGANNMVARLRTTLASTGGRIQVIFVKNEDELPIFEGKKVWGHAGTYVTAFALESEKDTEGGRRKIIGRLFHEIRARSKRPKELFDEEFARQKPAHSAQIPAFTKSLQKRFEDDNLLIQKQIERSGCIASALLKTEFANLTFAVHPDVVNRDYAMAGEKKKTDVPQGSSPEVFFTQPLGVLTIAHLRQFIIERLQKHWMHVGLPYEKVIPIVDILSRHADNPAEAITSVYKNFPELTDPRSKYNQALARSRRRKVTSLAKRLNPFIKGPVVVDFGGQTTDLAEAIVYENSDVQQVIVTDIGPVKKTPKDTKVKFLIQPSLDSTSLPNNSVDTVILSMVLHHMDYSTRRELLAHVHQILKPGGRLILVEDSYPINDDHVSPADGIAKKFASLDHQEQEALLSFFDWYGNRLMRRDFATPLPFAFESMESWDNILVNHGFKALSSEYVQLDGARLDLIPPKSVLVFEPQQDAPAVIDDHAIMKEVIEMVDTTKRPFPFSPLSNIGAIMLDKNGTVLARAVNGFGQQHAERLAILNALEAILDRESKNGRYFSDLEKIKATISYLRYVLKASSRYADEETEKIRWLSDRLGNPLAGVSLYVNLEPCPTCASIIAACGIRRVIYGVTDFNIANGGKGHGFLADKGIAVKGGILQEEAARQNKIPFFLLRCFYSLYLGIRDVHRLFYSQYARMRYGKDLERAEKAIITKSDRDSYTYVNGVQEKDSKNSKVILAPDDAFTRVMLRGIEGVTVIYNHHNDALFIMRTDDYDEAGHIARYILNNSDAMQRYLSSHMTERSLSPPSWVKRREQLNKNINMYFDENNADIVMLGSVTNLLVYADRGLVSLRDINGVEVIKNGNNITIYGKQYIEEATGRIRGLLKDKVLAFRRPEQILERINIPALSHRRIKEILYAYYSIEIREVAPLSGGRAENVAFLIKTSDGRKFVFKFMGRDRRRINILIQIALNCAGMVAQPIKALLEGSAVVDKYLINVDGAYFILEEFLDRKPCRFDGNYYYNIGRQMGAFHGALRIFQKSYRHIGKYLREEGMQETSIDNMMLDFNIMKDSIEKKGAPVSELETFFIKYYDFIIKQFDTLHRSRLAAIYNSMPRQIVHRDLSTANVFLDEKKMRIIDLETVCFDPRVLEFPVALIGRGPQGTPTYVRNSFRKMVEGYNRTASRRLSGEEILLIKLLVIHRYLSHLAVYLIKNPVKDIKDLEMTMKGFKRFCEECPVDVEKASHMASAEEDAANKLSKRDVGSYVVDVGSEPPRHIPFDINYPLQIFDRKRFIGLGELVDTAFLKKHLGRNMYYANAPPGRRKKMLTAVASLANIVPFIRNYFAIHYPDLQIINISLFGSYLYAENAGDIDLLVMVRGNHYGLIDIEIDPQKHLFGQLPKDTVRSIGVSIKGEDNFKYGLIDQACAVKPESQKPVLRRTTAALYDRHVVLFGPDFHNNASLLRENSLAEISDLLINAYNRYYRFNIDRLLPHKRSRKVVARLYEAAIYFAKFYPEQGIDPEETYRLRRMLERGEATHEDVARLWKKINRTFQGVCAARDEARKRSPSTFGNADLRHMRELVGIAKEKIQQKELGDFLPVVTRIVDKDDNIIATSTRRKVDPEKHKIWAIHAEIEAIREAEAKGFTDWENATMYTLLEPCYPCSRALTEFYGFKRVVYGIEDPTLTAYSRNRRGYEENNVEICECNDAALKKDILALFKNLFSFKLYDSEFMRRTVNEEQEYARVFRREHRRIHDEDIQTVFFNADLWHNIEKADDKLFLRRHLEMLKRSLNPNKKHVLLIIGLEDNCMVAKRMAEQEGIFAASDILIYRPGIFADTTTRRIADGAPQTTVEAEIRRNQGGIREIFIFDYDNTLANTGKPLSSETANALAKLLISGKAIAILTSRSKASLVRADIDITGDIKDALLRIDPLINETRLRKAINNIYLFSSKGSEKYIYDYSNDSVIEVFDEEYSNLFNEEEKNKIMRIVRETLDEYSLRQCLAGTETAGISIARRKDSIHITNIVIKFKDNSEAARRIHEIARRIQTRIEADDTLPLDTSAMALGDSIGINPKNKGAAIKHLADESGYEKLYYYGDDPAGTDKPVFDLVNLYGQGRLLCTKINDPADTLNQLSEHTRNKALVMSLFVTNRCTLDCAICFGPPKDNSEISLKDARLFIEDASRCGVKALTISGGEPLMHKDIAEIIKFASEKGIKVNISTSGLLLMEKWPEIAPYLSMVSIPIDGSTGEMTALLRGTPEQYDKVIEFLEFTRKGASPKIKIGTVVTKKNKNDLNNIAMLLQRYPQIHEWRLYQFAPRGGAAMHETDFAINTEEYYAVVEGLKEKFPRLRISEVSMEYRVGAFLIMDANLNLITPSERGYEDIGKFTGDNLSDLLERARGTTDRSSARKDREYRLDSTSTRKDFTRAPPTDTANFPSSQSTQHIGVALSDEDLTAFEKRWEAAELDAGQFLSTLSPILGLETVLDHNKPVFVFSEKVAFDNNLVKCLPKLAEKGIKVAVIVKTDGEKALIDKLNEGKAEDKKVLQADTMDGIRQAAARARVSAPRFYYFRLKDSVDPIFEGRNITMYELTPDMVKRIIDAIGTACRIEPEKLPILHEIARKLAEAA